jgi:ribonuclease HI
VGREEEGVSSLRPELAAIARTLQATALEVDLVYLCDSESALNKVSRWIGSGPRTTLAGDANVDIMTSIIECIRERVLRGARTFLVKVKAHRREPLNESADTQAENARQLPSECRQWTTRTQRMTYEWQDNDGMKHVTTWTKAVRNAMIRGGAEFHRQHCLKPRITGKVPWALPTLDCTESGKRRAQELKVT